MIKDRANFVRDLLSLPNRPEKFVLDITNFCNFQCRHCSQESGPNEARLGASMEQLEAVIGAIAQAGVRQVTLLGGEPTLHPQILDIVRLASRAGLEVDLVSNGWLIDDTLAEQLKVAGASCICLSIYGCDSAQHDAITDRRGSYRKVILAGDACHAAGMDVRLNLLVTSMNVHAMETLPFWTAVLERFDPTWVRIMNITPVGRARQNPELSVTRDQYLRLQDGLGRFRFPFRVSMSRAYLRSGDKAQQCKDRLGNVPAFVSGQFVPCCVLSGHVMNGQRLPRTDSFAHSYQCPAFGAEAGNAADRLACPISMIEFEVGPILEMAKRSNPVNRSNPLKLRLIRPGNIRCNTDSYPNVDK